MGICQTKHIENQYIINLNIEKELQMEAKITYIKLLLLGENHFFQLFQLVQVVANQERVQR
jgi:hypothetical protein